MALKAPAAEPLYMTAAKRIASYLKVNVDSFLEDYGRAVQESEYPGPECLEPEEVEEFVATRSLAPDRHAHIGDCVPCSVLLESALPSEELAAEFLARTRAIGEGVAVADSEVEERATQRAPATA